MNICKSPSESGSAIASVFHGEWALLLIWSLSQFENWMTVCDNYSHLTAWDVRLWHWKSRTVYMEHLLPLLAYPTQEDIFYILNSFTVVLFCLGLSLFLNIINSQCNIASHKKSKQTTVEQAESQQRRFRAEELCIVLLRSKLLDLKQKWKAIPTDIFKRRCWS